MVDEKNDELLPRLQNGITAQLLKHAGGVPPEEAANLEQASEDMAASHANEIK